MGVMGKRVSDHPVRLVHTASVSYCFIYHLIAELVIYYRHTVGFIILFSELSLVFTTNKKNKYTQGHLYVSRND